MKIGSCLYLFNDVLGAKRKQKIRKIFPDEIYLMIFDFLNPKELAVAARVCSLWRSLVQDKKLLVKFLANASLYETFFTEIHKKNTLYYAAKCVELDNLSRKSWVEIHFLREHCKSLPKNSYFTLLSLNPEFSFFLIIYKAGRELKAIGCKEYNEWKMYTNFLSKRNYKAANFKV